MRFYFIVCILLAISGIYSVATAVKPVSPGISRKFEFCAPELKRYCQDEKLPSEIGKCLFKHEAELSTICKQELQRIGSASEQASERGGGALSALGGLNSLTPPFAIISYEGRYSPDGISMNEDKLNFASPIYQTPQDYWAASLAGGRIHLGNNIALDSGTLVPNDLYRVEVGSQYTHQLPDHRNWGIKASVGYAGDKIFQNTRDTTFSLNLQYGVSDSEKGFWMWAVFISNNSPFGNYIPIPGVIYFYKTATFTGMFGFPVLSMQWTPSTYWAYSFSMFGPAITTEAAYGEIQTAQYFTSFNWVTQSFLLNERIDDKERLSIEEKKVALGVRSFVFGFMKAEIQAGYAFDRQVFIGNKFRNMQGGLAKIDSDWFVFWSLKAGF